MKLTPPSYEHQYLYILSLLVERAEGEAESDRTGTGTHRGFGLQLRSDLRSDFPLLTTKKVFTRGIIEELLWMFRGEQNIKSLVNANVHIWDEWADATGELGPVYGAQWRNWNEAGIDQIADVIYELKTNPTSRRMIVSAWNPEVLPDPGISPAHNAAHGKQALPPCHTLFQFFAQALSQGERLRWLYEHNQDGFEEVRHLAPAALDSALEENGVPKYWLDLQLYQRSADWFLGVPFNAVSYSLLLMMMAKHVGMAPRFFIHTFGDFHLYSNHIDQAKEQLSRDIMPDPVEVDLDYSAETPLDQVKPADIRIVNYVSHPAISAAVSV